MEGNSYLPQASRNFSKPEGSGTNLNVAVVVEQSDVPNKDQQACTRMGLERCSLSIVPSAATTPWCRSAREVTGPYTAATASARCAQNRHPDSDRADVNQKLN